MSLSRTPPQQKPSRSESDIVRLCLEDDSSPSVSQINITQRAKRRRPLPTEEDGNRSNENLEEFKKSVADMISNMMSAQNARMDKLENHLMELKHSLSNVCETNLNIEKSMSFVSDQLTELETKISCLETERNSMVSKLSSLELKIENYDRNLIKTSVEIRNVPKKDKESKPMLYDLVTHLSKHIDYTLQSCNIRDVMRQPSKKEQLTSNITIELSNTLVKAELLSAVKQYNKKNMANKLNSSHLGFLETRQTPIYVTELLSSSTKKLFFVARNFAKENQYKFCWTSNGRVMLKKEADSQPIFVKSELQLKQLSSNHA